MRLCVLVFCILQCAFCCHGQTDAYFYGRILSFSDESSTDPGCVTKYQITGDTNGPSTNWYWWSGAEWSCTTGGFDNANIAAEINTNITSFFEQWYSDTGGNFRWRAFLHSDGGYDCRLTSVSAVMSENRIIPITPSGHETGASAWLPSSPYTNANCAMPMTTTLAWSMPCRGINRLNSENVLRVNIDLSLNSGSNWIYNIAHGYPSHSGSNGYEWSWVSTPALWTEHARIAVRSLYSAPTNVILWQEGAMTPTDFAIGGVQITSPTNHQVVYQPGYLDVNWIKSGFTNMVVSLGTNYQVDLDTPTRSNSFTIAITAQPTGTTALVVSTPGICSNVVNVTIFDR